MAEVREEAIMEDNKDFDGTNLGTILKGSPFETQTSTRTEPLITSIPPTPRAEAPKSPEKSKTNGMQGTNKVASMVGKMQSTEKSPTKTEPAADSKSSRPAPSALDTKTTASKSKDSPTSAKKSPVLHKKDSPTTPGSASAAIKPKGGVSKITGIIQSSNAAKEDRAKAEQAEEREPSKEQAQAPSAGPALKPRGGVNKITGIIQSSNKAKEERAKAEQSESTNTTGKQQPSVNGGSSGIKPRGGPSKIAGILQSSNRAKAEHADVAENKRSTTKDTRPPSIASKPTAASKAHAQKQDKSSTAEQIKSPTTTRPTKLPSAATAGTAASAARKGTNVQEEEPKITSSERKSMLPQGSRAANTPTRASLAKKSSRASLANGEDRPRSRVSTAHKPTDEGFLARMTRPTASSARRAQETQVGSPPRARQASTNHENVVKKSGRKSLGNTSKSVTHTDEANETLLEPVDGTTGTGAAIAETADHHDEGEPGPAEEEGEDITIHQHQPQRAEVEQTTL